MYCRSKYTPSGAKMWNASRFCVSSLRRGQFQYTYCRSKYNMYQQISQTYWLHSRDSVSRPLRAVYKLSENRVWNTPAKLHCRQKPPIQGDMAVDSGQCKMSTATCIPERLIKPTSDRFNIEGDAWSPYTIDRYYTLILAKRLSSVVQ